MDYFLLYLILRLDVFSHISNVAAIIAGIVFAITLLISAINYNDKEIKKASKLWNISFGIIFIISLFFTIAVPSTKQAAVVYCLPKIVNNEQVQKMPDNLLRLANSWIDDQITETVETVTELVVEPIEN